MFDTAPEQKNEQLFREQCVLLKENLIEGLVILCVTLVGPFLTLIGTN